jgi:hypothetical protein
METVDVSININSSLEKVFDALTDHEAYSNFIGMRSVRLLQLGETEKNGKGAVREFNTPLVTFVEKISDFEKNKFYEYKVLNCFLDIGFAKIDIPLVHEIGRVSVEEKGDEIKVRWISKIEIDIPVSKDIAAKIFAFVGSESFLFILKQMKSKLEAND